MLMGYVHNGPNTGNRGIHLNACIKGVGGRIEFHPTCHYADVMVRAMSYQHGCPDTDSMKGFLAVERGDHLLLKEYRGPSHYLAKQNFGFGLEGLVKIRAVEMRTDVARASSFTIYDDEKPAGNKAVESQKRNPIFKNGRKSPSQGHGNSRVKSEGKTVSSPIPTGISLSQVAPKMDGQIPQPETKSEIKPDASSRVRTPSPDYVPPHMRACHESPKSTNSFDSIISKEPPIVKRTRHVDVWNPPSLALESTSPDQTTPEVNKLTASTPEPEVMSQQT